MGFFDELGKKVSDASQKTMQMAQEMSEVARINSLISQNENKINNVYYQIGKLFVSVYGNDCGEEFAGMVATVAELEQQNIIYKKQIQDVKGIQHCEKCGAEVAIGVAFCSSCGAAMPKVDNQPLSNDSEKCLNCGSLVKKGMRFCTACGKPMVQPVIAQSAPVEDKEENIVERFCSKCGAKITDDSVFCPECGVKL